MEKLKIIKTSEVNVTSVSIRRQLYSLVYNPNKEKASGFIDKFEELIRQHDNISEKSKLSDVEIRDAFYNSIIQEVPHVKTLEFLSKYKEGKSLDYSELKTFITLQETERKDTAAKAVSENSKQNSATAANVKLNNGRCYKCGDLGYKFIECQNPATMCYHCKRYEGHKADECPHKRKEGGGSGFGSGGQRYINNQSYRGGRRAGRNLSRGGGRGVKRQNPYYENQPDRKVFRGGRGNHRGRVA